VFDYDSRVGQRVAVSQISAIERIHDNDRYAGYNDERN
jgi:hypothetical protein